jgi:hypothetical protein
MNAEQSITTLPAGRYFIGDLCYVISDDDWMGMVELMELDDFTFTEGVFNGRPFAVSSTMWGDGSYESDHYVEGEDNEEPFRFGVDAGCIGVIRMEEADLGPLKDEHCDLGVVVDFDKDFQVAGCPQTKSYRDVWDGIIHIDDIEIYTD